MDQENMLDNPSLKEDILTLLGAGGTSTGASVCLSLVNTSRAGHFLNSANSNLVAAILCYFIILNLNRS
jgi:hypothetical protein